MGLKTILVCLTTDEHAETLLKVAVPLARKHGAHLIGLHTIEALLVYPVIAMHIPDIAFESFSASQKEESEAILVSMVSHAFARSGTTQMIEVQHALLDGVFVGMLLGQANAK
jgi:hypothetical protein